MHFDIEPFNYEGFDDHGVHLLTEDITYTVVFLLRDGFTAITTMASMDNEDITIHTHGLGEVVDADE